jgi:hypothetical protein
MDHSVLRGKIISAWAERYPDDQRPIEITEIVDKAFGGSLAAIRSKEKDGTPNEEMVYVYSNEEVKIFYNTDELVRFLEHKSRYIFVDILSDASFIAGFVFIVLIFLVFILGFEGDRYNKEAFIALSSVLGAAAGFFFGTKKT